MTDLTLLTERTEIIELFARYGHAIDNYDREGWVNCFTDDGVFEVQAGDSTTHFVGRQALANLPTHIFACCQAPDTP